MDKINRPDVGEDTAIWREDGVLHIDVRGLVPPEPMVAVLSLLKSGKVRDRLIVHINREPIHLYPELEEWGWLYETNMVNDEHYQVEIIRQPNGKQTD
jgi:hypothetical protein